jgi:hypothetical protein
MAAELRHGDQGGLCELDHVCPNCSANDGPCMDLFTHPECGLVACSEPERKT